jgi:hypothetical protein
LGIAKRALLGFLGFIFFSSLLGLGMINTANRTILRPEFIVSRLDSLDINSVSTEILRSQVPPEVTSIVPPQYVDGVIDDVVDDLEPWIRDQAEIIIYAGYDYLLGESEEPVATIDIEPAKEILHGSLWEYISRSPLVDLDLLPPGALEVIFNDFYEDVLWRMPSTIEINEDVINSISPDVMLLLERTRRYIYYLKIAQGALIGASAGLIAGIILINRNARGATFWLGIPCLVCGVSALIMTFIVDYIAGLLLAQLSLPVQIMAWLPQLFSDSIEPLLIFGIIVASVGTVLIIMSIVYRRHSPYA